VKGGNEERTEGVSWGQKEVRNRREKLLIRVKPYVLQEKRKKRDEKTPPGITPALEKVTSDASGEGSNRLRSVKTIFDRKRCRGGTEGKSMEKAEEIKPETRREGALSSGAVGNRFSI